MKKVLGINKGLTSLPNRKIKSQKKQALGLCWGHSVETVPATWKFAGLQWNVIGFTDKRLGYWEKPIL